MIWSASYTTSWRVKFDRDSNIALSRRRANSTNLSTARTSRLSLLEKWSPWSLASCECNRFLLTDEDDESSVDSCASRRLRVNEEWVNLSKDEPSGEDARNWENDEANCGENNDAIDGDTIESVWRSGDEAEGEEEEGEDAAEADADEEEEEGEEEEEEAADAAGDGNDGDDDREMPADSDEVDSSDEDEEADETAAAACGSKDNASALSGDDEAAETGLFRNCLYPHSLMSELPQVCRDFVSEK